jgi:microcystin-dependent protein
LDGPAQSPAQSVTYRIPQIGVEAALFKSTAAVSRTEAKMNTTVSLTAGQQRKRNWLPLLVFLFVISYGLLTTLVVLQDRTIDAQSDLIHLLFKANRLSVTSAQKAPVHIRQHVALSPTHPQVPSSQRSADVNSATSSTQVPLNQNATQVPSSQKKPQSNAKAGKNQPNAGKRSPFRPPAEMTDPSDMRRTVFSI